MPRSDSFLDRHHVFAAAAVIAAHANSSGGGFRQRDIRFLLDLFTNWVEGTVGNDRIVGTQVLRLLDGLVTEGFAKRTMQGRTPVYRLNRIGLLDLLSRLSDRPLLGQASQFFFVYYFLSNYGPRIAAIIRAEGKQYPPAMRLEIENLLDVQELIEHEQRRVDQQIQKLKDRSQSSRDAAQHWERLMRAKTPLPQAVKELEKKYPYDLNSQKPLSELLAEVPQDLAAWEMGVGALKRPEQIWAPQLSLLQAYRTSLAKLSAKEQ